jgi:hypothetical protein
MMRVPSLAELMPYLLGQVNIGAAYGASPPETAVSRDLGRPQRPNTAFIVRSSSGAGARLSQAARMAVTTAFASTSIRDFS